MKTDQYLRENGVNFEYHRHAPVYTAQELAAEEHVPGMEVAKVVVVKAGDGFAMCVLPACCKLDMGKLASALDVGNCRLADESEMAELFKDIEIGAEPPFGHLFGLPTVVDTQLTGDRQIMFIADTHRDAIEMSYDDYIRLAEAQIADISIHV